MLEIFLPLPLNTTERVKIIKRRQRRINTFLKGVHYTGRFTSVKDYEYERVAKKTGEVQVGINLFYLVDTSIIVGYRNQVGHYLRKGATNACTKQKVVQAKPKKVAKIGKGSSMYQ